MRGELMRIEDLCIGIKNSQCQQRVNDLQSTAMYCMRTSRDLTPQVNRLQLSRILRWLKLTIDVREDAVCKFA
jgi:hypothetical protein